jgi:PucR family transcriptional regulator, purine catabolism regulatory protein
MLTLRQALELACFDKARVAAGAAGLDQVVRRVHVIDIPDARYQWGRGALLLTAGYGLRDSPERQAALIPTLVANGLVGLVLFTGLYFTETPAVIREAAEAHAFPVIEVPPEVEFIAITERLYAEIVNEQLALKERAADIHRRLTRLVLEGGDLVALADTLAQILERSVLIESPAFEVLAAAQHGPVDESRRRAMELKRTPADRALRLLKRGVYADLQRTRRPARLPAMPDLNMTMERVVAPIVAGAHILGYIWVVAGDHPLADLDELAIDHGATVAALVLLQQQAVREAQNAARGDFLAHLLDRAVELDALTLERGHRVGYQFEQPHQALFVFGRLDNWLRGLVTWGLVAARGRGVVLVIEAKANNVGQALAAQLVADESHPVQPLIIGVGQVYPPGESPRRSYEEALEAAEIGRRLGPGPQSVCFWELGLLDWLYRLPADALANNPYVTAIQRLAEQDRKANTANVRTLEAYLEHGGALAQAAAALNIHRNTLLYRLGRVQQLTGLDLKDANHRLNLYVALKAFLLHR